ncbi:hypothetical protein ABBQ38_006271 [Trebouxia sp. C0009 RCD-2024]
MPSALVLALLLSAITPAGALLSFKLLSEASTASLASLSNYTYGNFLALLLSAITPAGAAV